MNSVVFSDNDRDYYCGKSGTVRYTPLKIWRKSKRQKNENLPNFPTTRIAAIGLRTIQPEVLEGVYPLHWGMRLH